MKNIPALLFISMIASCTSPKEKLSGEINASLTTANQSLLQDKKDTLSIQKATTSIEQYVTKFPEDTLSSVYLFELALLYEKQRKYPEAIVTLEKVYTQYPQSKHASKALFLEGYLYANVLSDLDKAKDKYELYLEKYSSVDAKLTSDVQMELENLGKTPEEILQGIQEKAKQDSAQVLSQ